MDEETWYRIEFHPLQQKAHVETWKQWIRSEEIRLAAWLKSIGIKPMIDPKTS